MLNRLKPWMMPLAMLAGIAFNSLFDSLSGLTSYLIFVMLLQTYCSLPLRTLRLSRLHAWLLGIQIGGSLLVFGVLLGIDPVLAQGVMICVLAPTAISAAVITAMLKGDVPSVATFSLLSNVCVALIGPVIFSLIGPKEGLRFIEVLLPILWQLSALLLSPLALAIVLRRLAPKIAGSICSVPSISFFLWTIALAIVTAKTTRFILSQNEGDYLLECLIAGGALLACLAQFYTGRRLGARYGEAIAAGQSLGQKNTVLAIWMAQSYLHPVAAIGPGAYVLWQNIVNSYQVWKGRKTL